MKKFWTRLFCIDHLLVCLVSLLLMGILVFLSFNIYFLSPVARAIEEFSLSDLYYRVAWQDDVEPPQSPNITLVDITPLYDRGEIADVLEEVGKCEPAVIGVDVIFEGEKEDVSADMRIMEVAADMPATVFANKLIDYSSADGSFHNVVRPFFANDRTTEGYVNAVGDMSSTCLRYLSVERKLEGKPVESFTAKIAEAYREQALPQGQRADRFINYRFMDFPVVNYDSIAQNVDLLKDRIVLLGTLTEEQDMHYTPLGKIPGLKVQGYAIQTLLDQRNVITVSDEWMWLITIIVGYITALWQFYWLRFVARGKTPFGIFLANSKILLRLLTFAWLAILVWLSYLSYERLEIYVPMAAIITSVILVSEARGLYIAFVKYIHAASHGKLCAKSIYL